MRTPRSPRHVRGQALTELAVCAAVLVPLFLLVPVVAKFGHANQMAQQAARNAAWEASVSQDYGVPTGAELQRRALERSFAVADAPIRSSLQGEARGEFEDQMLNTFSGRKLLERDNLRVANLRNARSPGFMDEALTVLPRVGSFPPNPDGYVTAEVELSYRNLENRDGSRPRYLEPFDQLDVVQVRRQSLLVDAWNASGPRRIDRRPRSVETAIRPLVPTTLLPPGLDGIFDTMGALEPILPMVGSLGDLELGHVEPDVVPADKLADYPVRR